MAPHALVWPTGACLSSLLWLVLRRHHDAPLLPPRSLMYSLIAVVAFSMTPGARLLSRGSRPLLQQKRVWSVLLAVTCLALRAKWYQLQKKRRALAVLHRAIAQHRVPSDTDWHRFWTPIDCAAWLLGQEVLSLGDAGRLVNTGIDWRTLSAAESSRRALQEAGLSEKQIKDVRSRVEERACEAFPQTNSTSWRCGASRVDITGPVAEVGMMGYAKHSQVATGLLQRLYARAFCFALGDGSAHAVVVICDLAYMPQAVSVEVSLRLQTSRCAGRYGEANILLCATHTHCAPGGLSCYGLYSLHPPLRGFDELHFERVVSGIVTAIEEADSKLAPAILHLAAGEVEDASVNRSPAAYRCNPEEEREKYGSDVDKVMTVLRIDSEQGVPIGMVTWFAVHPTSMSNLCTLINGDNKGCAALDVEKQMRKTTPDFVAGFANAAQGDVSPNVWGAREGDPEHDLLRLRSNASLQAQAALKLWQNAQNSEAISAQLRVAHRFVDFSNVQIKGDFQRETADGVPPRTCRGCIGMSFCGGAVLDGPSFVLELAPPGIVFDSRKHPTLHPDLQRMQKEKRVVLPSGVLRLTPEVLPLQVIALGGLLVLGVPFETTTMAGRRLVAAASGVFASSSSDKMGPNRCVIAGLSNAYCGYMTTKEEYAAQHYEGASTHFGPNQLGACIQHMCELTVAVAENNQNGITMCDPGPRPPAPPPIPSLAAGVVWDNLPYVPMNVKFGAVRKGHDAKRQYWAGHDVVEVRFWGGHPKNGCQPGPRGSFVEVQVKEFSDDTGTEAMIHQSSLGSCESPDTVLTTSSLTSTPSFKYSWKVVLNDNDIDTEFEWFRIPIDCSEVVARWRVSSSTPSGIYRVVVYGDYKSGWTGITWPYQGASRSFRVINPGDSPKSLPAPASASMLPCHDAKEGALSST
eukprot:TRINITY_DN17027_c0_g1_i1.p1 TRINITY_DN17027_c0_g1~~TRINITY_DN17027_c0_g1_i1.p1  ORF type:complete len:917 (-),score=95.88 TRINITY_DN17027_c0_g1_i1:164-2914(-)